METGFHPEDVLSASAELHHTFKSDEPIVSPLETLRSGYQDTHKKWKLRLRNLERWRRNQDEFINLDFQFMDKETTDKYADLERAINAYYTELAKFNIGVLTGRKIRSGMLVVVKLGDGIFRRARIYHFDPTRDKARTRTQDERKLLPKLILCLLDSNTSIFADSSHVLMYLVKPFAELPQQTLQFFLKHTEEFHALIEFRDALCSILSEEDDLEGEVYGVTQENIAFVTLRSSKFPKSVNQVLREMTVSALKKPILPKSGGIFSSAYLSHIDEDGSAFLQFKTYSFDLFKIVESCISPKYFEDLKKAGPYSLNTETIYLKMWDDAYFRCRVHAVRADGTAAEIYFIDYGNYTEVAISDLVPCALVSGHFEKFHPQVIKAHLVNIATIDLDRLYKAVNFDNNPQVWVETCREATADAPAEVEIIMQEIQRNNVAAEALAERSDKKDRKLPPFRLGQLALDEKFSTAWTEPLLGTTASLCIPTRFSVVAKEGTNWAHPSETPVHVEAGAVLDVKVLSVSSNGYFFIQPWNSTPLVKELEHRLSNSPLYKYTYKQDVELKTRPGFRFLYLEKNMCYALYITESFPGQRYVRARLTGDPSGCKSGVDKVEVVLIDSARRDTVEQWRLFYLEPEFCELPPQAALFHLCEKPSSGLEMLHRKTLFDQFVNRRVLIKVFESDYGELTGRCLIQGDIYKNVPLRLGEENTKSRSRSAAEAKEVDLGTL